MITVFFTILPWLLSLLTGVVTWLAGDHDIRAWYVGIAAQFFWIAFDIHTHAYGLLPIGGMLFYIYMRNLLAWRKASAALSN